MKKGRNNSWIRPFVWIWPVNGVYSGLRPSLKCHGNLFSSVCINVQTNQPTSQPTNEPTSQPTNEPTSQPPDLYCQEYRSFSSCPWLVLKQLTVFLEVWGSSASLIWRTWYKSCIPSDGSNRRARRPCLELLCTNILSETARTWPSTFTVVDTTTCRHTHNFINNLQETAQWTVCILKTQSQIIDHWSSDHWVQRVLMWRVFFHNINSEIYLWLRGRVSVLLLEGHWFNSPGLHVEVPLGKILNPNCTWCAGLAWQPPPSVWKWINYWESLWTKASEKCCKSKKKNVFF